MFHVQNILLELVTNDWCKDLWIHRAKSLSNISLNIDLCSEVMIPFVLTNYFVGWWFPKIYSFSLKRDSIALASNFTYCTSFKLNCKDPIRSEPFLKLNKKIKLYHVQKHYISMNILLISCCCYYQDNDNTFYFVVFNLVLSYTTIVVH